MAVYQTRPGVEMRWPQQSMTTGQVGVVRTTKVQRTQEKELDMKSSCGTSSSSRSPQQQLSAF